jgi:diguanylate cyclase (GGDEF)-like protein
VLIRLCSVFKYIEMIAYHGSLQRLMWRVPLSNEHFLGSKLLAIAPREILDALVIFSVSIISYHLAVMDWGGFSIMDRFLGAQHEQPSLLYFVGIALVVFSIRRIIDQRNERVRRVAAEQHAHDLSMRDPLTQLPNRAKFEVEASARLRRPNSRMTVLLLGLSQFKRLHDVYGHLGCDATLLQVTKRLQDRIDSDSLLARIGDDEFALSLSHVDPEVASKIASSLVEDVKEPVQIGIEHLSLGANVGIAQAGRGQVTVDELLRCAHVALSRAKKNRTEYCFFDPMMDAHVRERSLLELDLVKAIGRNEIQPYYQPIVDLRSRQIVGFEALARWRHPVSGFIPPDKFIPVAEELGQMELLWRQLFGAACRDALTWPDDIALSFNFSPSQLSDRQFADKVLSILSNTGLPAHRLEAEITENAIVTDIDATRHAIETLRNSGVRIVIDDFGTGYSSLSHLYELRFDKLKIDKRFVQELGMTSESEIFMRAIIGLCGGLNLCTTAEGVETEAQASATLRHGVDQAQGFLFSKAVCSRSVMQLLSTSSRSQRVA